MEQSRHLQIVGQRTTGGRIAGERSTAGRTVDVPQAPGARDRTGTSRVQGERALAELMSTLVSVQASADQLGLSTTARRAAHLRSLLSRLAEAEEPLQARTDGTRGEVADPFSGRRSAAPGAEEDAAAWHPNLCLGAGPPLQDRMLTA